MKFADTSFWFALQERRDRNHTVAATLARTQVDSVVVSNHVLGETWTLLRRRAGHQAAVVFLDRLSRLANVSIERVNEDVEDDAWRWLRRRHERQYSFVDATSFALMRSMGITEAFAFDGDFSAAGFVEVRP